MQHFALRGVVRGDQGVLGLLDLLAHALEQVVGGGAALAFRAGCSEMPSMACSAASGASAPDDALGAFQHAVQILAFARSSSAAGSPADVLQGLVDLRPW